MKKLKLLLVFIIAFQICKAQDPKAILQKCHKKCQSIKNGYYEMNSKMKFMSGNDTFQSNYICHFKKLKNDSIYSSAFHNVSYRKGKYSGDALYTGNEFVNYSSKDSSGTLMTKALWGHEIKAYKNNNKFYLPFTLKTSEPIQHDSDFLSTLINYKFLGEELVNGQVCFHIVSVKLPEKDTTEMMYNIKLEYHYWISKKDDIPVQFSEQFDMVMNNDTMIQYELQTISNYKINHLKNNKLFNIESIPSYYRLKDFVPYKRSLPLPNDTIAPIWSLQSLENKNINLSELKGKLVLIDFFYKSCYPCMQAIPGLQALHQKYKDSGLVVIGINPYDKQEDGIKAFLDKRNVTYPVLLDGAKAAKDYRISGYPTMYFIGKDGRILAHQIGYGKGIEEVLEEIIKKNL